MAGFDGSRSRFQLEAWTISVGCNYIETITNSVLFPDCKGDQAGHVAREEVAATWLQVPVVVLAEQLEPRREQLPLGLGGGVELRPRLVEVVEQAADDGGRGGGGGGGVVGAEEAGGGCSGPGGWEGAAPGGGEGGERSRRRPEEVEAEQRHRRRGMEEDDAMDEAQAAL